MGDIAAEGFWLLDDWVLKGKVEWVDDEIDSTSLTFGDFNSRSYLKFGALAETSFDATGGGEWTISGGVVRDDNNRGTGNTSPVFKLTYQAPPSRDRAWQFYLDLFPKRLRCRATLPSPPIPVVDSSGAIRTWDGRLPGIWSWVT